MIQEELAAPGRSTEWEWPDRRPIDPVRVAVHAVLALYLSPVIVLVAVIGASAVGFQWLARMASKILGRQEPNLTGLIPRTVGRKSPAIGSKPIMAMRRKSHRAIR